MKTVIRYGLGAALAGALALGGAARAQTDVKNGPAGTATGSGSPESVGQGDTGRQGSSASSGGAASQGDTSSGMTGSTGSSDQATGGGGASAGTSGTATGTSSAGPKLSKSLQDKLEKLHSDNQAEMEQAKLAAENAQSPDVKQFAEKVQSDHQQLDQKLTDQAQTLGVSLEGKTFQKEQQSAQKDTQKLQSKTGKDFDKAYLSQMVKDHKKDAKEVGSARKEAQKQHQAELASLLQQAETGINGHLHHAQQLEKSAKSGGTASGSTGSSSMGTGSSSGAGGSATNPSEQPGGAGSMHSGSRGDTGGPTPGGQDTSSGGSQTTPGGGAKGTSSDSGTK